MSMHLVVVTMVAAAMCHAGWNLLAKSIRGERILFIASLSVMMAVIALPWALLYPPDAWWPFAGIVLLRASLQCAYVIGLGRAYDLLDFSLAYPATRGTGPVIATLLGILLLGERPAPMGLGGVALVSLGVGSLALVGGETHGPRKIGLREWRWPIVTGTVIGCYTLVDKVAVSLANVLTYLAWSEGLTALTVLSAVGLRGDAGRISGLLRDHWRRMLVCGLLATAAYGFALYALSKTYVSYVAPLREMSVLFGVVLSGAVLHESGTGRRLICAGGIVGGVVLIALAL